MSLTNYPLVSIITVNYNQIKVTEEFLDSLRNISYPNYEVIVVDNASKENSIPHLVKKYPEIIGLRSDENLGFAGGNNLGIRKAKGDYFLMLNNDTEVDPGFLEPLVEAMLSNTKIGMVGAKVMYYNQPGFIQYAGSTHMSRFTATSHFIGNRQKDEGQFDIQVETPYTSGAAMMVSRKACERVGLMAGFFFLYYEELDWQTRIRKAGYEIYYIPKAVVFHKESVSVGKQSSLQAYWKTRNRLLLIRRNSSNFDIFISYIYISFVSTPWQIVKYFTRFKWRSLKVHGLALGWHYINLFNKKRVHQNDYL